MEWDGDTIMKIAIGVFFLLFGVGIAYALFRLGALLKRLSIALGDANTQVISLLTRLEDTLAGVNAELGKVDAITDSVAGIVRTAEQTTTGLQAAVVKPVSWAAGVAAGVSEGVKSFFRS